MTWKDDVHGKVFRSSEIKLYYSGAHTWAMKLSQLARQTGTVRIITYSLPDMDYVKEQFDRRPNGVWLICNSKFKSRASEIKRVYPEIKIAFKDDVHSKVLLIEPKTVYITSANFGLSGWHETTIGVRSKEAHDSYVEHSFNKLWKQSKEVKL